MRLARHVTYSSLIALSIMVCTGCQKDPLTPVQTDPSSVFWKLSLNYHAIVLSNQAPHNTVQLVATPFNAFGDTLRATNVVTFSKLEPLDTTFTLSATGAVTAQSETARSAVIVRSTIGGITLADTGYIMIRAQASPVPLTSFSIRPVAPDSNWMWAYSDVSAAEKVIPVIATDADHVVPDDEILVAMWPEPSEVLRRDQIYGNIIRGSVLGDTGSALVHAEVLYYGTLWTDSMRLHVIPPPFKIAQVTTIRPIDGPERREFQPSTLTISAGSTVRWTIHSPVKSVLKISDLSFLHDDPEWPYVGDQVSYVLLQAGDTVDIVFDHPELIDSGAPMFARESMPQRGNIPAWAPVSCTFSDGELCEYVFSLERYPQLHSDVNSRTRSFPFPGTYHYHSTRDPSLQGTVVVTDSVHVPQPASTLNAAGHVAR